MSLWCGASKRRLCACIWKINVMENIAIENVACLHGYSLKYFLLMTCAVKVCYSKKGMDILPLIPVCTSLDFCHWWSSLFSPEAFIIILRGQVTLANQCSYKYLSIFLCTCWTSSFKSAFSSHMSCHVQYFFSILTFQFLQNMFKFNSHVGESSKSVVDTVTSSNSNYGTTLLKACAFQSWAQNEIQSDSFPYQTQNDILLNWNVYTSLTQNRNDIRTWYFMYKITQWFRQKFNPDSR